MAGIMAFAPVLLRWGRELERRQLRGGTRLLRIAARAHLLPQTVSYPLSSTVSVSVPVRRESTRWDDHDIATYEEPFLAAMVQAAAQLPSVHLIDVGADIGIFALKFHARVPCTAITAFEPNPRAFPYLQMNLSKLACQTDARQEGVSNQTGRGRLTQPAHDADDHARYVTAGPVGDFPITRLDDCPRLGRSLVIKVDTEGTERDVIRSASEQIRAAERVVIGFEAHAAVLARTEGDPLDVIRALPTERRWTVSVAEQPDLSLDLGRPIAPQLGNWLVVNLVCVSD
jgi:FkbM family methyltransferase